MPKTPPPQTATNEVAKITSTIHFKNKYNNDKNIAVVVLNINYQQKSFSITPLSGSQDMFDFVKNNFAIIDNDIAITLDKWKAITKGIDQAGEYVKNEFLAKSRFVEMAAAAALVAGCIMIERDKRKKKEQANNANNKKVLPKNNGKKPTVPQAVAIAKKVQKKKADELL